MLGAPPTEPGNALGPYGYALRLNGRTLELNGHDLAMDDSSPEAVAHSLACFEVASQASAIALTASAIALPASAIALPTSAITLTELHGALSPSPTTTLSWQQPLQHLETPCNEGTPPDIAATFCCNAGRVCQSRTP